MNPESAERTFDRETGNKLVSFFSFFFFYYRYTTLTIELYYLLTPHCIGLKEIKASYINEKK